MPGGRYRDETARPPEATITFKFRGKMITARYMVLPKRDHDIYIVFSNKDDRQFWFRKVVRRWKLVLGEGLPEDLMTAIIEQLKLIDGELDF